jgi:Fic family protein
MYIYNRKNWPHFTWNQEDMMDLLIHLRHLQGRLVGGMESFGFKWKEETLLETLTEDVIKTSEIEGEFLEHSLVRSSVARRLGMDIGGLDKSDRNVDGVVEMMIDATQQFNEPLSKERLFNWHGSLFPTGRSGWSKIQVGCWRSTPIEVVSGPLGKEKVHYEGPPANKVDYEMELFLDWVNNEKKIDLVLKAAIAHLWFVTIHPFSDGNGRIGRAIADLLLARSENSSHRFYSLSAQIQKERKQYYTILESTQKGELNITPWIKWFCTCLERSIENASENVKVIKKKAHFWESINEIALNDRQRKIINQLLDGFEGKLTTSKWATITKCSQDTAQRDIYNLVEKGVLIKNPEGGRSTSYSLKISTF